MEFQKTFEDKKGMTTQNWITVIASSLYVFSPIDLIPDVIPVIGWADDLLIAVASVSTVLNSQLTQSNRTLSSLLKAVQYISFSLFVIIGLLSLLLGSVLYQIFTS